MIIEKSSWHFRFLGQMDPNYTIGCKYDGTTLCEYIRKLVKAMFWAVMMIIAAGFVFGGLGWAMIGAPLTVLFAATVTETTMTFATAGVGLWIIVAGSVVFELAKRKLAGRSKPRVVKPDNIFLAYIKAKKAKFCPIIEVK